MNYSDLKQTPLMLRDWALEDQPMGKIETLGSASLTNAELLSIVIGSGSKGENVLDLSKRILAAVGNNIIGLAKMSQDDLMKFKGIGQKKASRIVASMELTRRRMAEPVIGLTQIRNSKDIYRCVSPKMVDLQHEECLLLLMNNQHRVLDVKRVSKGGVSETTVDPKIILKFALDKLASSIILVHNHPSGNPRPSMADDKITHKLKQACDNMDIQFLDHIIVAAESYYSYADEGKL
jgi:DNA repair protein RadC